MVLFFLVRADPINQRWRVFPLQTDSHFPRDDCWRISLFRDPHRRVCHHHHNVYHALKSIVYAVVNTLVCDGIALL